MLIFLWIQIAEKQRYEISSCKVLAADPNGGTIAAFSDSKGKLTVSSPSMHE